MRCAEKRTDRTAALYLSTPNNPAGVVFPRAWVEALVAWAAAEGCGSSRTRSTRTTSTRGEHTYARIAGARPDLLGALVLEGLRHGRQPLRLRRGSRRTRHAARPRKVSDALVLQSAPTASQLAACRGARRAWATRWVARDSSRAVPNVSVFERGRTVSASIRPQGSTFLFLDVAERLDDRGLLGSPGGLRGSRAVRGARYELRAVPRSRADLFHLGGTDVVGRGVDRLAGQLGR